MFKWKFSIIFDVLWSWEHVLFISEVFLCSPTNQMVFPSLNQMKDPQKYTQKANQNNYQNTGVLCRISSSCIGFMVDNTIWLVGEHKNTSEMKSTCPQLHKTSKNIEKLHLSMKLC